MSAIDRLAGIRTALEIAPLGEGVCGKSPKRCASSRGAQTAARSRRCATMAPKRVRDWGREIRISQRTVGIAPKPSGLIGDDTHVEYRIHGPVSPRRR